MIRMNFTCVRRMKCVRAVKGIQGTDEGMHDDDHLDVIVLIELHVAELQT